MDRFRKLNNPGRPAMMNLQTISPSIGVDSAEVKEKNKVFHQRLAIHQADKNAEIVGMIHRGHDEVLDLTGRVYNPAQNVITNLVTYTVPNGKIALFDSIAIWLSDPLAAKSEIIGWRITDSEMQPPEVGSINTAYRYDSNGALHEPFDISPLYVQANQIIAIELFTTLPPITITIAGRLSGQLYKRTGGIE